MLSDPPAGLGCTAHTLVANCTPSRTGRCCSHIGARVCCTLLQLGVHIKSLPVPAGQAVSLPEIEHQTSSSLLVGHKLRGYAQLVDS